MASSASQFIDDSVKHPDWLRVIESGDSSQVVQLCKEQGYECSLVDLKQAAAELLKTSPDAGESNEKVNEAASGLSDLESESGYGDDTGYAALYGVAGAILKMS